MSATVMEVRQKNTFSIGLIIALSSWGLIFVTLVWGYIVFRLRASSWLQGYLTPQAQAAAFFNTLIIGLSSLFLSKSLKEGSSKAWSWMALVLGVLFSIGQVGLWQLFLAKGLHWQSSIAGSFFFLLTGFHFLHIVAILPALLLLSLRMDRWRGSLLSLGIKYFWDFLFVVWLVMFILIFIIH
jgi:heme/copper-type cytochrome/quinol oxidase subunit 3